MKKFEVHLLVKGEWKPMDGSPFTRSSRKKVVEDIKRYFLSQNPNQQWRVRLCKE